MPDLFILGAGGHAAEVADVAVELGYRPIFAVPRQGEVDSWAGDDEIVLEEVALGRAGCSLAIGIGDSRTRAAVARRLTERRGDFPTLIHPQASFGRGARAAAEASRGTVIFAGARFTTSLRLGDFVAVNLNVTVSHDAEIGHFATLSPGARVTGNVVVGEGALIGANAVINQGRSGAKRVIGAWSTIGSGAVVVSDCEPGATYVGVPARKR